jgi:hypothetical protein
LVILHPFPEKPHDMKRKTKIAQNAAGRMWEEERTSVLLSQIIAQFPERSFGIYNQMLKFNF